MNEFIFFGKDKINSISDANEFAKEEEEEEIGFRTNFLLHRSCRICNDVDSLKVVRVSTDRLEQTNENQR